MTLVDRALLNLVEGACHRFQRLTGRTNVWLAFQLTNLSIILYLLWVGSYVWRGGTGIRIGLGVLIGLVVYGLSQTVLRTPIEASEASAFSRVAKGLRNPRRVRDALLRVLFLTLSVIMSGPFFFAYARLNIPFILLGYSLIVLTTVILYLLACDPLPPGSASVAEWFRLPGRLQVAVPRRPTAPPRGSRQPPSRSRRSGASRLAPPPRRVQTFLRGD